MKNKVLASTMAIGLSVVSAVSFVGCKGDNEANVEVSMSEFSKVVKSSYDNTFKELDSVESFQNLAADVVASAHNLDKFEREHIPDGETEAVKVTYTNESYIDYDVSFAIKMVDGALCFQIDSIENRWAKWYDEYEAPTNAPLALATCDGKEILQLVCGVDDGVYYMRAYAKAQETWNVEGGETETEEKEDKFYKTYENKDEYLSELADVLDVVGSSYISAAYMMFEDGEIMLRNSGALDVWKTGDVYVADLNLAVPMVDYEFKQFSYMCASLRTSYTELRPKSINFEVERASDWETVKENTTIKFLDEATLTLAANALDGYTENTEFDFDDYICRLERPSGK